MKKINRFIMAIFILAGPFLSIAYSGEIKLSVNDVKCVKDGEIAVHYGLNNTFDFDYSNVTLGFKVLKEGKPVACKELKVTVPKGADGSKIYELKIDVPCAQESYSMESAVFYYVQKRYMLEQWFSDCK